MLAAAAPPLADTVEPLLEVDGLTVRFGRAEAVREVSLRIRPGETVAIVGESGSGKSVTGLSILGLIPFAGGEIASGSLRFRTAEGVVRDLARLPEPEMRRIRGAEIAMIFQEPMTALNPVFTVGSQISETILEHRGGSSRAARAEALNLLKKVRLPDAEAMLDRYPHQLSGGMRQRVVIAMALSCQPRLLIADEPTTALDVTVQAQIVALIQELKEETGAAVIFITHDMGLVAETADDVVVLYEGRKVEEGPASPIFAAPQHAYTRMLLDAVPRLGQHAHEPLPSCRPVTIMENGVARKVGETRIQDTVVKGSPLLEVERLTVRFDVVHDVLGRATHRVHAAEAASFAIQPGETLALVGESGSGKSTVGKAIQQLVRPNDGEITFDGTAYSAMSARARRRLKRDVHSIFQDPLASLNPRRTVGDSIAEPIRIHGLLHGTDAIRARVRELMERVGLRPEHDGLYPHQFSGGQRQRLCIARALAAEARLIVADEAVSALDVSIQAQIVRLLMTLQAERRLSYLFISHDMAVVEEMAHRVAVMYLGQIVEIGPRQAVIGSPRHPYTQRLLASVPVPDPDRRVRRSSDVSEVPSAMRPVGSPPEPVRLVEVAPGHLVAET
ncbi:MAG: ABC transporter ATP-binding protein [Pseudomonadota bacterium]